MECCIVKVLSWVLSRTILQIYIPQRGGGMVIPPVEKHKVLLYSHARRLH
jgi:hypothetical protein